MTITIYQRKRRRHTELEPTLRSEELLLGPLRQRRLSCLRAAAARIRSIRHLQLLVVRSVYRLRLLGLQKTGFKNFQAEPGGFFWGGGVVFLFL